jgi:hypothetical protein
MGRRKQRTKAVVMIACASVTLLAAVQFVALVHHVNALPAIQIDEPGLAAVPAMLEQQAPQNERSVEAYTGYGTWVDVYDFMPAPDHPGSPQLTVASIDDMARYGVKTLYLQAAQLSEHAPGLLVDRAVLGQILVRAQRHGMRVVGWYLPKFKDLDRDLAHLQAIADFEVLGHRFDGLAVDIEWTQDVTNHSERSNKLVELSRRLRSGIGAEPLGAIVLSPVQLEVINSDKWPSFPWRSLAEVYDVWLPMGYWTQRTPGSGYRDGRAYTEENVDRLRKDLGDREAMVHVIGGIGDEVTPRQAARFADAVSKTGAVGGSIYDWVTTKRALHEQIAARINSATTK